MTNAPNPLVLWDWKKEGAFIGTEFVLQLGGYALAPHLLDKTTGQVVLKPPVAGAVVCTVGEHGVKVKLALNRTQLDEAERQFERCLELYRFIRSRDTRIEQEQGRYKHPLKPGESLVSVTQVLKHVIAKPGLMDWSYDMGLSAGLQAGTTGACTAQEVEAAIAARLLLDAKTVTKTDEAAQPWVRVKEKVHAAGLSSTARRDKAGDRGSLIHKNVMFYLQGKAVDLSAAPEWLNTTMSKFAGWAGQVQLEPLFVETQVFDGERGYAGTLDLLGTASATVLTSGGSHG